MSRLSFSFMACGFALATALTSSALQAAAHAAATELTLYRNGEALIKEERSFSVQPGAQTLRLSDFPFRLNPESVQILRAKGPQHAVRKQLFRYDNLDTATLLYHLVGQEVTFEDPLELDANKQPVRKKGILRTPPLTAASGLPNTSYQNGAYVTGMVIVESQGRRLRVPTERILIQDVPDTLAITPELEWELHSAKSGQVQTQIGYLCDGLPWNVSYTATLLEQGTLRLQGWLNLENLSGKAFEQTDLTLVAGELHRANRGRQHAMPMAVMKADFAEASAPGGGEPTRLEAASLGDYHVYRFPVPVSLPAYRKVQLSWMHATSIPYESIYVYDPNPGYFWQAYASIEPQEISQGARNVERRIAFRNSDSGEGFGLPLPEGSIRLLQSDAHGAFQLIGEDSLPATPEGERIEIQVGKAFDVLGEKSQVGYREGKTWQEVDYKVTLRNRKKEAVKIVVLDTATGDWDLLKPSMPPLSKKGVSALRFEVPVAPQSEATLTYTLRQKVHR
jgi:hypothetical protein